MLERRTVGPDLSVLVPTGLEAAGFLVAFTERTGGVSTGPYRSLNLGLGTDDELDRVRENRRRLIEALGIPPFTACRQVHGAAVARVGPREAGRGFAEPGTGIPATDALVTSSRGLPLAVLAADCVPVVLARPSRSRSAGRLAVAHAGWRGIAAGIVGAALAAVGGPDEVRAAIGPAVGPDHYEVGGDVALAVSAAVAGGAVLHRSGGRIRLDLGATVERILREQGVRRIERAEECTACLPDRFYSHRRDGRTGRQAAIAVRLA